MRRLVGMALLAGAAIGCTSVKMEQRGGCWVRKTEKPFGRVLEEVGPCARPEPRWAADRVTRLVQECLAQADWRRQANALEVWSRRLPYPTPQPRKDELLLACMDEARSGISLESDATGAQARIKDLSTRIAELSGERDALRGETARDREDLRKSHDKLTEWLGMAAQRPPGNATAPARPPARRARQDVPAAERSAGGASGPARAGPAAPPCELGAAGTPARGAGPVGTEHLAP